MILIVGLGNPGRKYEKSRHNLGFMCISYLARKYSIKMNKNQGRARTGNGTIEGSEVLLARPQTFMNNSGQSVNLLANKYHVTMEDLIVIHDDLDLPAGKIRIRCGGSSGGHKGIESIIAETGSREFCRIRIGIGHPPADRSNSGIAEDDIIDFVLSGFTSEESVKIEKNIPVAAEAIASIITEGVTAAMNRFNSNRTTEE
jgi:PTH1 family peptidyl-tRNA hydrolase